MANQSLEPYVELLRQRFGIPQPGTIIFYPLIDQVLTEVRSMRNGHWRCSNQFWYSVVGKWRRELESKHNIVTKAIINVGIKVLLDDERITYAGDYFVQGARKIKRCHEIASKTSSANLNQEFKDIQVYYIKTSKGILVKIAKTSKNSKVKNSKGIKILHNIDK